MKAVFDTVKPEIFVVRPKDGNVYDEFYNFGGTMTDDHASGDVQITIQDTNSGKFFNADGKWQDEKILLPTMLNVKVNNWHMTYRLPSGSFELNVTGTDAAGNRTDLKPMTFTVR